MLFGILGAVEARRDDGTLVPVGGPRVRTLLALLLLDAGRIVSTERLVDGLYGEHPPAGAGNALQSQISRLRRSLDAEVEFHPAGYRLAIDSDLVDAHRFERLAGEGHRRLSEGHADDAVVRLDAALALWRGPVLAGLPDNSVVALHAARLADLRTTATEDRAEALLSLGRHRDAISDLRDLIAAEPLRERARALLIRALHAADRNAEALATYEDLRHHLAEALGADPSPALSALHLAILRNDRLPALADAGVSRVAEGAPAPTALRTGRLTQAVAQNVPVRRGLPARLTSFVGREDDLARVGKLLGSERLVTVLGPGGTGKTRLAVEAAVREDGEVCFVDLAPVGEGTDVPRAVLSALGGREAGILPGAVEAAATPIERLVAVLGERRVLLVLDNCEHVAGDAAGLVARLLATCPGVRILATSREALAITAERLWPLAPLGLPEPDGEPLEAPAVRLFADRAAAVSPGFRLDAHVDDVVRICAALDGLPLALELAAARLRSLPVAEVAIRLGTADRFRLLSRGDRTAAPRHQTLRAVVEWSWELLSEPERELAARFTVFSGGASLEAVAAVCGAVEADDVLADLAEKSLIQAGEGRYRMLETIRAYCAERLDPAEREPLRRAHAEFFLRLARTAEPELLGGGQVEWLKRLAADHANLHAALRWAARSDHELALRLVAALSWYWWLRGLRGEGAAQAADLLEAVGSRPPPGLAEEFVLCGIKAVSGGALAEPEAWLDAAAPIMAAVEGPLEHPYLTVLWSLTGGPRRSDKAMHERQLGSGPWSRAIRALGDGFLRMFDGDPAAAEAEFTAGLQEFRVLGDRWGMANCLDPLAALADWRGEHDRALALLDEALELVASIGGQEELGDQLTRRADTLIRGGNLEAARAACEQSLVLYRRAGATAKVIGTDRVFGDLARRAGDLAEARRRYETARADWNPAWFGAGAEALVAIGLAWVELAEGAADTARALLYEALGAAFDHPNLPVAAGAIVALAGTALFDGDAERAAVLLGAATALRGSPAPGDPDVEQVAASAQAQIGTAAYTSAYATGTAVPREEALALATRRS